MKISRATATVCFTIRKNNKAASYCDAVEDKTKGMIYMAEITLTNDNFKSEVLESDLPVLVDFWASWCGPCRMLAPTVAEIAEEYAGQIKVGKVNVDDEAEIAEAYGIVSIPTLILFKNGKPAATSVGYVPKERIEAIIEA